MAIIDLVRWQPQNGPTIYAYRFPQTNLSTYTQLLVSESQEALLFSKGRLMGKFGPGKHTLDTENLPILRHLYGLPFGGKNPFTAEVWFVNKIQVFNIDWRITRLPIHDADYNTQIPLYAAGQYGLKIVDSEKFLINFVGTRAVFSESDMTEQSRGEFTSKAKSAILQFMMQNHIGFKQIGAYLDSMSTYLRDSIAPFWSELGLELTKFYINEIDIDDSSPDGRQIREAIAQQSSMSITGRTWQQEQLFETANSAISNISGAMGSGGSGGLLGGIMAINMMNGMMGGGRQGGGAAGGGVAADMMRPQYNQPTFGPSSPQQPAAGQPAAGGNAFRSAAAERPADGLLFKLRQEISVDLKFLSAMRQPVQSLSAMRNGQQPPFTPLRQLRNHTRRQCRGAHCPSCNAPLQPEACSAATAASEWFHPTPAPAAAQHSRQTSNSAPSAATDVHDPFSQSYHTNTLNRL